MQTNTYIRHDTVIEEIESSEGIEIRMGLRRIVLSPVFVDPRTEVIIQTALAEETIGIKVN